MNRFDGLKYSEIAAKLAIPVKTVEANMSKALKKLRTELSPYAVHLLIMIILLQNF
jgi:RNA polymerase sigma-70 factor (ECF subfamily)